VRLLLIRHAHHDYIGKAIAGWLPGVSPLERALETAAPLAAGLEMRIEVRDALREIDFGEFTGRTMAELEANPMWHQFNLHRGDTRAPAAS
jgi:probable phosphoglycerate mutase